MADVICTLKDKDGSNTLYPVAGAMAEDSIETVMLKDNSIVTDKLADNTVTNTKLADNTVTNTKLADNTVTTTKIANGTVTDSKLANSVLTATAPANSNFPATNDYFVKGSFISYWTGSHDASGGSNLRYLAAGATAGGSTIITSSFFSARQIGSYSGNFSTSVATLGTITLTAGTHIVCVEGFIDFGTSSGTGAYIQLRQGSASGPVVCSANEWGTGSRSSCAMSILTITITTTFYLRAHSDTAGPKYSGAKVITFRVA